MKYEFIPNNKVCPSKIEFEVIDNKLHNLVYTGGCNGNLKALGKILEGYDIDKVIELLKGNECGLRGTSCADQLTIALEKYKEENN